MENPNAHPILGASIALGGPFIISALAKIINPSEPLTWPFNVIIAFTLKMIPHLIGLALIALTFFAIYKGILSMIKKIKLWIEAERNKLRDSLIYRQENFERKLENYIKWDHEKREEDFIKLEELINKLIEELQSSPMHPSIKTSNETVIKNFI